MKRIAALIAALLAVPAILAGCAGPVGAPPSLPERPLRIVSLDYCADQYVLKLVGRDRILAVSPDAARDFSYMRGAAAGVAQVRPNAEDVLALRPDLVVRSYGGGPNAADLFARAGVPVLQLPFAPDLAGVRAALVVVADGLGAKAAGARVLADLDTRLAVLRRAERAGAALYLTPGGVTTGPGSLVHEMIAAAGHRNFEARPGWHPLPLERLVRERPDLVAAAAFASAEGPDIWSAARHPIARAQTRDRPVAAIDGAMTACGGWFVIDAIEAMARIGRQR